MNFRHLIMTRFNLATPGREAKFRNQPAWLSDRFDLFERYCLPTIVTQTCQAFDWIIYFDVETPQVARDRIERARRVRAFTPYYTPLFESQGWRNSALDTIGDNRGDALLTTNLDNDDGLADDFVARVQAAARAPGQPPRRALNITNGFVLNGPHLFAHRHVSNAFTTLLEPYDEHLKTAPAIRHMDLALHLPVIQVQGPGGWLQVVHGGNVSNRVRGKRVGRAAVEGHFPAQAIADVVDPTVGERLFETLLTGPGRIGRDLIVGAARSAVRFSRKARSDG